MFVEDIVQNIVESVKGDSRIHDMSINLKVLHGLAGRGCADREDVKEAAKDLQPGERIIHGHEHRLTSGRPATTRDSICVCAKWHGWKPLTLAEAIRQMDAALS